MTSTAVQPFVLRRTRPSPQREDYIPGEDRLAAFLKRLASATTYSDLGDMFDMSEEGARQSCHVVAHAILLHFGDEVRLPTKEEALVSAQVFRTRYGISNVVGAVDGSHVPFR
jgi:hypothetical protein